MSLVCPRCDVVPALASQRGALCAACGAALVAVDDNDPLIGTMLDERFLLRERLGAGAMGTVYRATQLSIGRDVAVKVIAGMNATTVKRFFREAQIASALSHPNTVQIIEFGQNSDGRVYIAMELVRGHTLLEQINRGAMSSRRIVRIATQLCDALEAAHRQTIVHRDLKPENIMVAHDGSDHVKILDFGIARVLGDASSQVTGAGFAAGTPSYMAPEVLGDTADPAPSQDIYALGVIIAELALGRALWRGVTLEALYVNKVSNAAIDDVPSRFRPLVLRLLDGEPTRRPSAAEARMLLREVERVATDPVGVAPTMDLAPAVAKAAPVTGGDSRVDVEDFGPLSLATARPKSPELTDTSDLPLELERSWAEEHEARKAGKPTKRQSMHRDAPPRRNVAGPLTALVLLGGAAAAVYYIGVMRPSPPAKAVVEKRSPRIGGDTPAAAGLLETARVPVETASEQSASAPVRTSEPPPAALGRGVSIRIVGNPGTPIKIDGNVAGKTPLSLKRTAGKRTIEIRAPGFVRRVVPDRDQTIDISEP